MDTIGIIILLILLGTIYWETRKISSAIMRIDTVLRSNIDAGAIEYLYDKIRLEKKLLDRAEHGDL